MKRIEYFNAKCACNKVLLLWTSKMSLHTAWCSFIMLLVNGKNRPKCVCMERIFPVQIFNKSILSWIGAKTRPSWTKVTCSRCSLPTLPPIKPSPCRPTSEWSSPWRKKYFFFSRILITRPDQLLLGLVQLGLQLGRLLHQLGHLLLGLVRPHLQHIDVFWLWNFVKHK